MGDRRGGVGWHAGPRETRVFAHGIGKEIDGGEVAGRRGGMPLSNLCS